MNEERLEKSDATIIPGTFAPSRVAAGEVLRVICIVYQRSSCFKIAMNFVTAKIGEE
jgi:hypothetical protein